MQRDFKTQLKAGRVIEECVNKLLRDAGYYVIPSYDWSGPDGSKAPSVLAPKGWDNLVMPDLQTFDKGVQRWLEVKWKWWADYYRKHNVLVTGISQRLYEHYRAVQAATGAKVHLLFVHHKEAEMRGDAIDNLANYVDHTYDGRLMGKDGMVFWPYERIPRWGSLDVIEYPFATGPTPEPKPAASAVLKPLAKAVSRDRERERPQLAWDFNPREYRYAK